MTESNRVQFAWVRESTFGTTPATPRMRIARITGESLQYTPQFVNSDEIRSDRMMSDPIKVNEQNQGGVNVELSFPVDNSPLSDWMRSAMYNTWVNTPVFDNDGTADSVLTGVVDSTDTFSVASGGASCVAGHLIRTTGFTNSANNGLFKVSSSTGTTVVVAGTPTLTDETAPPAAARLKVVGFEGASGDITATSTGLGSTSLDFTTLGLAVGQWVKIGGTGTAYQFGTAALNTYVRITAIAANALTLDNLPSGWTTDSGTGKTIRVFVGDYIRNGTTRTSGTIERGFLGQGTPTYITQAGMVAGQMDWTFTTEQKVTGSFNFMGLTGSQSTTALDASPDAETTAPIMSANVNVGRIAEAGSSISSPNWARSLTVQLNNNLRMITALGSVGAVEILPGECSVSGTIETYFGSNALLAKLLNGTVGSINARLTKSNQTIVYTVPRVTFTGGAPSAGGKNQDVLLPLQWQASKDSTTAAHIQIDRFEYVE